MRLALLLGVITVFLIGFACGRATTPGNIIVSTASATPSPFYTAAPVSEPPREAAAPRGLVARQTVEPVPSQQVIASWYGSSWNTDPSGDMFWGNRTACGQLYDDNIIGVAHRSLPCGTMVMLSYRGTTMTVPVIDRGPFIAGREFDLSSALRRALNCSDLCPVVWRQPV